MAVLRKRYICTACGHLDVLPVGAEAEDYCYECQTKGTIETDGSLDVWEEKRA